MLNSIHAQVVRLLNQFVLHQAASHGVNAGAHKHLRLGANIQLVPSAIEQVILIGPLLIACVTLDYSDMSGIRQELSLGRNEAACAEP